MPASDCIDPPAAGVPDQIGATVGDDLETLRPFGLRRSWPAGATLLRQGQHPPLLYVIERGEVALWDESGAGRRLVQIVHAGASIGDLPALLDEPCLYTAVTRVETDTLAFSREMVHDLLELDPQICFLWLRLLARRLEPGYPRNVALAGRSAVERLGLFILNELEETGGSSIELTQTELASATGLSRQRVSGVLGALERLGVLERHRGGLRVLDTERLREMFPR
jgi:CRP-like cAMP-binding protein